MSIVESAWSQNPGFGEAAAHKTLSTSGCFMRTGPSMPAEASHTASYGCQVMVRAFGTTPTAMGKDFSNAM